MELFWYMDEDYVKNAENLAQRMEELGVITQMPDMDALFDLSFLNQPHEELQK